MHPLNGPAWSLFYEYIGNLLYGLFVRRFSKVLLGIFVFLAACLAIIAIGVMSHLVLSAIQRPTGLAYISGHHR